MRHDRHGTHARRTRGRFGPDRRHDLAGGGFGTRPRRGKIFDGAQFQLILLRLIAEQERHGYELMREIEARTSGAYTPSPGVVYPTLTLLLDMGLVAEAEGSGARKTFTITQAGRETLAERSEEADALFARLDALGNMQDTTDSTPVRRAMGNLRQVLETRLSKPSTTDEHMLEAARLIDEAASRIERLP